MITLVADCPKNNPQRQYLEEFVSRLGPLPEGVVHVAQNVWLVDEEVAVDFLLLFGRTAERESQNVRAYSTLPKRPAA